VFRVVVLVTFVFSIPDVIGFLSPSEGLTNIVNLIPFAKYSLGWVLPALILFLFINIITKKSRTQAV
jgi:LIVCS family branched-chain amino acid:cation transporter